MPLRIQTHSLILMSSPQNISPPLLLSMTLSTFELYLISTHMKNQQFELKLLVKQNTEMAIRLQSYRRENHELTLKNSDLNSWVQNLSEVFASIGAAWKIITDNEQALFTLIRKKTDPSSKQRISKYINHFKTFDEIIMNLGDKITNQGHSDKATIEAKSRLTSFVSNYNLFFMEFVDAFFKFNEECISFNSEMLKENNLPLQFKQIANQSIQNRQRIKDFEEFMVGASQNYKIYQSYNQHKLLDGIIVQKEEEIQLLKDKNNKQARRINYMTDYSTRNISAILEHDDTYQCFCGGAPLQYYRRVWQESIKAEGTAFDKKKSSHHADQSDEALREKIKAMNELQMEKQYLMQRNVQILAKCQKIKQQNKMTDDLVLQSPLYLHLRSQFKDLMDYTNDLTQRLNKSYEYLNQLEKARMEELQEFKKKSEKAKSSSHRHHSEHVVNVDHTFLQNFRDKIDANCTQIKRIYAGILKSLTQKEENLQRNKDSLKFLKKENEDLNRRLGDLQERQSKNVEHLEFRHQRFNELEKSMNEILKSCPKSQDFDKTKKTWEQLLQYTKTRDKKIKAMEEAIKKKDRELGQKQKIQEVLKSSMTETEQIYQKYKQKLDCFQEYMKNMNKEIQNLSEQNYKIKMQSEQEKNLLNIQLKNELQVKIKLQEKVKNYDKFDEQIKSAKLLAKGLDQKMKEYQVSEKQKINQLRLELKDKDREICKLNNTIDDKEKQIEKLIEDKEKKNIEIGKLKVKLDSQEIEVTKMELEEYKAKILCRCGAERQREVVLKTCPHIFCKKCIDDTTANRNRKCPICGIRFTKTDIHQIVWT